MFPLRDFLNSHGRQIELEAVRENLRDLLPNSSAPASGAEVFQVSHQGLFEFKQSGYNQQHAWPADTVILPDSLTAMLLVTTEGVERSTTTLLVASITSATFKPGQICQENTHITNDR